MLTTLAASILLATSPVAVQNAPAKANTTATTAAAKSTIVDTAVAAGSFKTLVAAVQAAGLVETLNGTGPFTVFAPTDEAFAKLPAGTVESLLKPENKAKLAAILTYHVVPGSVKAADVVKLKNAGTVNGQRVDIKVDGKKVTVDGATVTATDIACSNGVIHVIDTVILPVDGTVVDVAAKNGSFNTLVAAVKAAGLVETLSGKGPFTILAPTDAAFAKLPAGTLEMLLKPENKKQLAEILSYHVVPGVAAYSDAVVKMTEVPTVLGSTVAVKVSGDKVMLNGANVVAVDVEASNGVIHVIDTVLLPGARTSPTGQANAEGGKTN
ncbi:MAG: fasciclin domain-containing protein [Planctomycetaceae bacterium]|nr:fasciclin domain-containing protein [Planctomycetaceae bacterium]